MKQCSTSWHFWLGWAMWFVKLFFSSPFLKTRTLVSWPNENLLTQCEITTNDRQFLPMVSTHLKASGSLRTKVSVSPGCSRWALYPQMFPAQSYGPDYSHTCSTQIVWWQKPITKFIRGLWPCCLVNKVIMIKKCPWTSLHACAHTHTGDSSRHKAPIQVSLIFVRNLHLF